MPSSALWVTASPTGPVTLRDQVVVLRCRLFVAAVGLFGRVLPMRYKLTPTGRYHMAMVAMTTALTPLLLVIVCFLHQSIGLGRHLRWHSEVQ